MDLDQKIAVITGGASGLGLATAKALLNGGTKVALLDLNEDQAKAVAADLGNDTIAVAVDVSNEQSAMSAIGNVVDTFGAIHINVNCAGVGAAARTLGREGPLSLDLFNRVLQINLVGTFNTLRLCAAVMQKNEPSNEDGERGVIINTASVAAYDGQIGQAAYSASKGGVVSMTLPIARDLSRNGIRLCTIAPGIFETPMMRSAPQSVIDPLIEALQFPKRLGEADEFALLAKHIVENTYLNGETIRLDGGIRMQPR